MDGFYFSKNTNKNSKERKPNFAQHVQVWACEICPFFFRLFLAPESAQLADIVAATFCNVLLAGR
jgi:hypothetical protein